jgi:hypothetical protein
VRDDIALSGTTPEWGSARGLPRLGRRVADGAVGRIRPPHVVQVGVPVRIGLGRVHQTTAILLVDGHLLGKQKPGTQPRRLSPSANTAATPRASPIPPAAITGTGAIASTTAGTKGSVAT